MKGSTAWLAIAVVASVAIHARADSTTTAAAAQDAPKQGGDGKKDPAPAPKDGPKSDPKTDPKADPKKAAALTWGDDYEKALAAAKKEKKIVLADFTGSDWCPYCIKLREQVFTTPEFKEWATKNLVLLEVDFPHKKELSKETKKQNEQLKTKMKVGGLPNCVFISPSGEALGHIEGYDEKEGAAGWMKQAQKIVEKAKH